jgi:prepilin-type N-terminal cleavage/methylation domain-containing protein
MTIREHLRRLTSEERGVTLVEMLIVMIIMAVVTGSLTTLFVQGSNAEVDLNNRFQAQNTARVALDKLRREIHCATVATPTGATASITLSLPSYCKTGSGSITWCTRSVSPNRYALYRVVGSTCTGGIKWADYLITQNAFTFTAQSATSLAMLRVDLNVNVNPQKGVDGYELKDDIVLRNSSRS